MMYHRLHFFRASNQLHLALLLVLAAFLSSQVYAQRTPSRDTAEKNYRDGLALLQKQQVDPAITLFREAIRLYPAFAEVHASLGFALGTKGQLREAIAAFEIAIKLKPDFAEAHYYLGTARWFSNDVSGAITALRSA
ncbi:MAG: tetratricopeptide repeat protein, partial [Acidobacteriota bacterium]|nr:tetratricopeptide repeat protein [Acidobacteriota bacterium]